MVNDAVFEYSAEKSARLRKLRGLGFEEIIEYIESGHILDVYPHPNHEKYPHELMYAVNVNGYVYLVPFVPGDNVADLKTLYPSRAATRKYLGGGRP